MRILYHHFGPESPYYSFTLQDGWINPSYLAEEVASVDWTAKTVTTSQVHYYCLKPYASYAIAAMQLIVKPQVSVVDSTTVQSWYCHVASQLAAMVLQCSLVTHRHAHPLLHLWFQPMHRVIYCFLV